MESRRAGGRIEWIDIAKGIGIILVVFGHSLASGTTLRQLIFSFHMPLFFFLAGCTFHPRSFREMALRSAKSLLIPYSLLFFCWNVVRALASGDALGPNMAWTLLTSFVFASGTTVKPFGFALAGMAWFLVALFFSRLLFNAQFKLTRRFKRQTLALAGLSVGLSAIGLAWIKLTGVYLPGNIELTLFCQQYMLAGYLLRNKAGQAMESLTPPKLLAILMALIVVWYPCATHSTLSLAGRLFNHAALVEVASYCGIFIAVGAALLVARAARYRAISPLKKLLLFGGQNSLGIFCIHAMDWGIAWAPLASLATLPCANELSGAIRVIAAFCVLRLLQGGGIGKPSPAHDCREVLTTGR
jgi:fucose 4-O-acetylase-like acetyltransferase